MEWSTLSCVFLPIKLAKFIEESYGFILGIPSKQNRSKWNSEELNTILMHNLVMPRHGKGHLRTFGCIQWESDWFNGRPKANCYPFDFDEHHFQGGNSQVKHMGYLMRSYVIMTSTMISEM